jgi:hypothetical protein
MSNISQTSNPSTLNPERIDPNPPHPEAGGGQRTGESEHGAQGAVPAVPVYALRLRHASSVDVFQTPNHTPYTLVAHTLHPTPGTLKKQKQHTPYTLRPTPNSKPYSPADSGILIVDLFKLYLRFYSSS